MTPEMIVALAPLGILLLGALLCLLLEAAGTPVGAVKRGARSHLAVVALVATCGAFLQSTVSLGDTTAIRLLFQGAFVVDGVGTVAAAVLSLLGGIAVCAAVPSLRELREERGEIYALILIQVAALCVMVQTRDVLLWAVAALLSTTCMTALASLERMAPHGAELAAKWVAWHGFSLVSICFGAALLYGVSGSTTCDGFAAALQVNPAQATVALGLIGLPALAWLPVVPLHFVRVDTSQGAPAFAALLQGAGGLVVGAIWIMRLHSSLATVAPEVSVALLGFTWVTLWVPALAALDQRQIGRMLGHLSLIQAGVVIAPLVCLSGAVRQEARAAVLYAAIVGAITYAGLRTTMACLERPGEPSATWERWSGAGRRHPVLAGTLLGLMTSVVGLPGTAGFVARLHVSALAFRTDETVLGALVLTATALGLVPVVRLAVFLFAKPSDEDIRVSVGGWWVISLVLACLGLLLLVLFAGPVLTWLRTLTWAV